MNPVLPLITAAINLVSRSPSGQKRRNLKIAQKTYKNLKKICLEDGVIDDDEKELLDKLKNAIAEKAIDL